MRNFHANHSAPFHIHPVFEQQSVGIMASSGRATDNICQGGDRWKSKSFCVLVYEESKCSLAFSEWYGIG
jgi:hypothetical protein